MQLQGYSRRRLGSDRMRNERAGAIEPLIRASHLRQKQVEFRGLVALQQD